MMKKVRLTKAFGNHEVGNIFDAEPGLFMGAKVWRLVIDEKLVGVGRESAVEVIEVDGQFVTLAEQLAQKFKVAYGLTHRSAVNLEGTINNMLHCGMKLEQIDDVIADIYDNYEVQFGN